MKTLLRPLAVLVFAGLSVFALTARATITDVYWNFSSGTGAPNHVSANVSGGMMSAFNFDALYTPAFDTTQSSFGYSGVNGGSSGLHNASVEVNNVAGPVTLANLGTATYFEFTLAPDPGLQLVATDFELGTRSRAGFGPQTITFVASTDGFATFTTLGSTSVAANSTWNLACIPSFSYSAPIDTAVTFRIYGTDGLGGVSGVSNWRIDDVTFSVVAVPEPSTYASLFVGVVLLGARALRRRKSAVA